MTELLRNPITAVWGLLVGLTLVSWWTGTGHGVDNPQAAAVLVLIVAFFKVRLVGLHFMELHTAPIRLRAIFEGWCATVCTAVVVLYLVL